MPVIVDRDANLKNAVDKIVMGASFDNGIICSHEQFVLVHEDQYDEALRLFEGYGQGLFYGGRRARAEVPRCGVSGRLHE